MGLVRLLIDHLCCYRDDHITSNQVAKFTMPLQGGGKHGDINTPSDLTNESMIRPMEVDELTHNL